MLVITVEVLYKQSVKYQRDINGIYNEEKDEEKRETYLHVARIKHARCARERESQWICHVARITYFLTSRFIRGREGKKIKLVKGTRRARCWGKKKSRKFKLAVIFRS